MALPELITYAVDSEQIMLYWNVNPRDNVHHWNIYGTKEVTIDFIPPHKGVVLDGGAVPANAFVKIRDGIANRDTPLTPGSAMATFTRTELGIGPTDPYYFTLTSVDKSSVESALDKDLVHAVPLMDDFFTDEAGWPINVVYKNFEFDLWPLTGWDEDRVLDIEDLLGRPAKEIKIDAVGDNAWVRFNSINNDPISIRYGSPYPFDLKRGELLIKKIYIHNPSTNDITVRIFVAA